MRLLALLPILSILASCSSSDNTDRRGALVGAIFGERAKIDPSLFLPCAEPVSKPATATDLQVGRLWDRDRDALRECAADKAALAASVQVVE